VKEDVSPSINTMDSPEKDVEDDDDEDEDKDDEDNDKYGICSLFFANHNVRTSIFQQRQ
jgi:hypothetical protein